MTQGAAGLTILSNNVGIADGANLDAFSRLRVSQPSFAFDAQLTYDLQPLLFEQVTTNGGGGTATVTHDSTNRCALMTFTSALTGAKALMQSYEWIRYQPGRSQMCFVTFNFIETMANVLKFAGIGDGANGVQFELNGSTKQLTLYSDTARGDETVTQTNWNLDKLDGTGASGLTLDITKTQILVIDFQALYVGRVRVGFNIGGKLIYVHEFTHTNIDTKPYIQNASLPIRCGMTSTGTVTTTMNFICSSVISEGGEGDVGGFGFAVEFTNTASNGAQTHIGSIRPKTTFNSIANRSKLVLDSVDIIVTGNSPVKWQLCLGQAITGASWADVNTTYSTTEASGGTISGTPAIVIAAGYCAASASQKQSVARAISSRYPMGLDAAGAARALGTLSVVGTGIGGSSAMRATINWREIR